MQKRVSFLQENKLLKNKDGNGRLDEPIDKTN